MLSRSAGWLFIHLPKTGGTSLQLVLAKHSDDQLVAGGTHDGVEQFDVAGPVTPAKHATLQDYRNLLPPEIFARLFKFAIIRDPWERAISWYFSPHHWLGRQRAPVWSARAFRKALQKMPSMISALSLDGNPARLDMVLRHETLVRDSQALFRRLGIDLAELPHKNRGFYHASWRQYYADHPDLIDWVGDRFAADAEMFGYRPPALTPSSALPRRRSFADMPGLLPRIFSRRGERA